MAAIFHQASQWHDNKRAFETALADLRGTAAAVGLDLSRAEDRADGWPQVLHAEVRPVGGERVLASLEVGLSEDGLMLFQTSPGEARTFSRFRPRDRAFYIRRFCSLIEVALRDSRHGAATPSLADAEASQNGPARSGDGSVAPW